MSLNFCGIFFVSISLGRLIISVRAKLVSNSCLSLITKNSPAQLSRKLPKPVISVGTTKGSPKLNLLNSDLLTNYVPYLKANTLPDADNV